MSLPLALLARQISECTACPLAATRCHAVPGEGPQHASLMLIGEAPGAREDAEGRPFVGASGKLLSQLLLAAGISREETFITSVLKCHPPANRDPHTLEIEACKPHLTAQILAVDPLVIVPLGRHALAWLLPDAPPISRCHGIVLHRNGRAVVPVYHPAAALYRRQLLPVLQADLAVVAGLLSEQGQGGPSPDASRKTAALASFAATPGSVGGKAE